MPWVLTSLAILCAALAFAVFRQARKFWQRAEDLGNRYVEIGTEYLIRHAEQYYRMADSCYVSAGLLIAVATISLVMVFIL